MRKPSSIKLYTPPWVMCSFKELKCQLKCETGALQDKCCPFLSQDIRSVQKQWIYAALLQTTAVKRQHCDSFTQRCDLSLLLHHHYQGHRWWNEKIIHTCLYTVLCQVVAKVWLCLVQLDCKHSPDSGQAWQGMFAHIHWAVDELVFLPLH